MNLHLNDDQVAALEAALSTAVEVDSLCQDAQRHILEMIAAAEYFKNLSRQEYWQRRYEMSIIFYNGFASQAQAESNARSLADYYTDNKYGDGDGAENKEAP